MPDPSRTTSLFAAPHRITLVSGLPRAGTSLLMQVLAAAGLPIARDDERPPDPDNPRGYFELAAVKSIRRDTGFLAACHGRVVKIVAPLLLDLPGDRAYRVLFVERDLGEILASQRTMLLRPGSPAPTVAEEMALERAYRAVIERARAWLAAAPDAPALFVSHAALLASPLQEVERIAAFLERTRAGDSGSGSGEPGPASQPGAEREPEAAAARSVQRRSAVAAMTAGVDPALYRSRAGS